MPMIANFPVELLEEHRAWHHMHMLSSSSPFPVGYGLDFLQFHRNFIRKALDWYMQAGHDPALVTPWPAVPEPIRRSYCYNLAAEDRIVRRPETFASADELGRFIEGSGLHGCIHEQAALLYGEPELNDFDYAPRHTEFYQFHGLIDRWYRNWEGLAQFARGLTHWCGSFDRGEDEVLFYRPEDATWWLGRPQVSQGRTLSGLEWSPAGCSREFGPMEDGRPLHIRDVDGDGRSEIVFFEPVSRRWITGKLKAGRICWYSL
jgi:hypothetical protein